MRANQKDSYFTSSLRSQIQHAVQIFKGQRFVNLHPEEITVFAKALYYLITTVIGARTLGEEYVDIMYVTRLGKRLPRLLSRFSFALSFVVLPYFVSRTVRKWRSNVSDEKKSTWLGTMLTSYPALLDTIMNIHIALFYFEGLFYSISKRLFGLRYAFGHHKDPKKLQRTGNYSVLGAIMMVQFAVKLLLKVKEYTDEKGQSELEKELSAQQNNSHSTFFRVKQLQNLHDYIEQHEEVLKKVVVDLSDPLQLPYIPEASRSCMLCLSPMVDPSLANCGHMFCWECIVDWVREHPECPLCRQVCLEQNLLPLR